MENCHFWCDKTGKTMHLCGKLCCKTGF